jgi:glycine betaine/proline transport system substrate-binding protein
MPQRTGCGHLARTAAALAGAALAALALAGCGSFADDEGPGVSLGGPGGDEPGGEVRLARASWDTGFFQAEIHRQLLEELGYDVSDPAEATHTPETFYPKLARSELDLWANGWFPLHEPFLDRELVTGQRIREPIEVVGVQVPAGARQGFLADKETAEELGITSIADFTRDEVASAFDRDGDARADLYGCDDGWGCQLEIEAHRDAHEWGASVEQVSGDYTQLLEQARQQVEAGEPALFYTWTPNWTVEVLEPGEDVVWLEAPPLPDEEASTAVKGLEGCAGDDPCELGWAVNDIRAVANAGFLEENPPARRLLEEVEVPLEDIATQNAEMAGAGDYGDEQVADDAAEWIADNRDLVDEWLATARGE